MAVERSDPEPLSFRPRRRMTRWYEPVAMLRLLARIWATRDMGNQRDGQPDQDPMVLDHSLSEGDYWFDYVADLGDGFDPTMAVAWHLGRIGLDRRAIDPRLRDDPEFRPPDDIPLPPAGDIPDHLPRGRLLVMGGDQVYPEASHARYRNQLVGPYDLAWEVARGHADGEGADRGAGGAAEGGASHDTPQLLAIPANHDWYGGSDPFQQTFCADRTIGGRRTAQRCTWWSARWPTGGGCGGWTPPSTARSTRPSSSTSDRPRR